MDEEISLPSSSPVSIFSAVSFLSCELFIQYGSFISGGKGQIDKASDLAFLKEKKIFFARLLSLLMIVSIMGFIFQSVPVQAAYNTSEEQRNITDYEDEMQIIFGSDFELTKVKRFLHLRVNLVLHQNFSWLHSYTSGNLNKELEYLMFIKIFLEYIQRAQYTQAPLLPVMLLIFREDMPRIPMRTENDIKYIPENVLLQLDQNIEYISPPDCIPIVILLRATGWRISDILNLRYDNCLDKTSQGWYLCGDIQKTQVLNHRVPITDDVAAIVKSVIEVTKPRSTSNNNPNRLLFVCLTGKRIGQPPESRRVSRFLNVLAKKKEILDDQGNIFHFKNHAFRHTKAIQLINNGMNLLHVQKWMAHASPEMTLWYAKILDTTMRKSWEEATKQGLFRINESGNPIRIDISDIENEDIIEWEYIRHNLDAVRMPLGYCMKPKKQECHTQLNPCLTCRNLCTTPDFIPQYELEIQETKAVIERGITQNRSVWVEKNQALLERYEKILDILKGGKTHHKAGKKGREYIGEERKNE